MPRTGYDKDTGNPVTSENMHSLGGTRGVIVTSMNDIPGYRVVAVLGAVYGLTVRSRNIVANIGAGFKSLVGGELGMLTKMVHDSRNESVDRMISDCLAKGGNAILAMRFESGEFEGRFAEVCAYGTACIIEKA
ncbi:putative heavy-metal-binding-domain-containing protein [Lipomyces kononenkoae]|uniref:Heavy-metal-binding-domain-containing protein n=1 Tax=Lipomyces kononenkoae TaxID=34357 RepID=A0ACC3STF3_LIPKO